MRSILKAIRLYIVCFRAEQKRYEIEMNYKYLFEFLELDWYGYLELQRMKNKELRENGL